MKTYFQQPSLDLKTIDASVIVQITATEVINQFEGIGRHLFPSESFEPDCKTAEYLLEKLNNNIHNSILTYQCFVPLVAEYFKSIKDLVHNYYYDFMIRGSVDMHVYEYYLEQIKLLALQYMQKGCE